jgi:SAM-dependent methyltransferase
MYVRERLRSRPPGHFVEVGVGGGALSRLLLRLGWQGIGYDISYEAAAAARDLNREYSPAGVTRPATMVGWRLNVMVPSTSLSHRWFSCT